MKRKKKDKKLRFSFIKICSMFGATGWKLASENTQDWTSLSQVDHFLGDLWSGCLPWVGNK